MADSSSKPSKLPEIFIALTIVGLLGLTTVVALEQTQRSSRDAMRKQALESLSVASELFKEDYGVYPHYSAVLGSQTDADGAKSGFDVGSALTLCQQDGDPLSFVAAADLQSEQSDLNAAYLRPGFASVNRFLTCLSYGTLIGPDPLLPGTVADYQYRVSSDASTIVLAATLERGNDAELRALGLLDEIKRYYLGNGLSSRSLFDDSDYTVVESKSYFQSFLGKLINNGQYLYQCLRNSDGRELSEAERMSKEFAPFIHDAATNTDTANPACQDEPAGLRTVSAN